MFEIGDYVVNAANGICRITELVEMDLSGSQDMKQYFLLIPVEEPTARVYIPLDTAESRIRKAITREEALAVIDRIPEIPELVVRSEKERELKYREAVKSCDPIQLAALLKMLYRRRQERMAAGKKNTAVDERYFKMAESHLYSELAFVIGEDKSQMVTVITNRIEHVNA